jgi:DNA-binding NarL/FixJ family response regulator
MTTRVLVVDDQRVVRDGLSALLDVMDDVELVGAAENGSRAVELAEQLAPDVVLMDLRMPEVDGVEATRLLRERMPQVAVVVLTTHADDDSVFAALRAGARGYLTKDAGAAEIARAISLVAAGQALLDPAVQARLLDRLDAVRIPVQTPRAPGLTERETEVLELIATGLSNAEIAQRLVVSEATVKTHVNRLFAKTGVRDRAQAVAYAYRTGIANP